MNTKKYFASTLLASAIVLGGLGFSPAMGQEQAMQPQGAWAISKVDHTATGGNSYCTLSRKYDDGVVMSLARNTAEEYSLALDFQKPTFDKDKALKINLQPGPGKLRAYDMMPASDKAVVIRLGWDEGFFETLDQSQQMKVKIGEQSYAFAVPLIAKGQADLEDCVEGLKTSAKGTNTNVASKDVLTAQPGQASKAFDAGRVDAPINAAALQQEKAAVDAQEKQAVHDFASSMEAQEKASVGEGASAKKSNFNKYTAPVETGARAVASAAATPASIIPAQVAARAEPASGSSDNGQSAAAIASLQKQIADLSAENGKLQAKASTPSPEITAQIATLQKQLADAAAQNQTLQAKSSAPSPQVSAQLQTLQKQLADVTAENAALKQKSNDTTGKIQMAALQKQVADLTSQNAALQTKAAAPSPQTTAQVSALEKQIASMTTDMDALKKKANGADDKAAIDVLEKHLADLSAENAALQTKSNTPSPQVAAQIAALQKAVGDLRVENADLKVKASTQTADAKTPAEISSMAKQIADLQGENASLKQKVASAAPVSTTITALPDTLAEKKADDLQKQLTSLQAENIDLKTKMTTQLAQAAKPDAAQNVINDLKTRNKDLQDKLAAVTAQSAQKPDAADVADAMDKAKDLESKNAQLQESLRQAQTRIAETAVNTEGKSLKDISELQIKLDASQKDNIALAKQLDDIRLKQDDGGQLAAVAGDWSLEKATRRLNEGEREIRRLGQQLEQEKMSCNKEKSKIEAMLFDPAVTDQKQQERLADLEGQLQQAQDALKSAGKNVTISSSSGNGDDNGQVADLTSENAILKSRVAELEQADNGVMPSTMTALPDSLSDKKAAQLQKDMNQLKDENIVLKTQTEKMRLKLADAGSTSAAKSDHDASAQLALEDLKRDNAMKASQNLTYQNQLAALQQENGQLKSRLSVASSQPAAAPHYDRTSMVQTAAATIEPAAGIPAMPKGKGFDGSTIQSLLKRAGVSANNVQKINAGLSGADNYGWSDNTGVKGFSSVKTASDGDFDSLVKQYIAYQKSQCGGDFASMPSPSAGGAKKMALFEVACVGKAQSTSSSLLFFSDQGHFIAISNQTGADDMDVAMDSRDRIASVVKGL